MANHRDTLPYLIQQALQELGRDASPQTIAEKVKRLEIGLPAEDELAVLLRWLGRCQLVHKLDQSVPPANDVYRIPDLLAVFEYRGRPVPVLIEVKACEDNTISWRPDYYSAMRNYAGTLNLPLLIAWRHLTFWVLFDVRHFTKASTNFNIQFSDAMKQTLMSVLAGDFSYSFAVGSGMHINMRKLADTEDGFEAIIEECYLTNGAGERLTEAPGVLPLFLCVDQSADRWLPGQIACSSRRHEQRKYAE